MKVLGIAASTLGQATRVHRLLRTTERILNYKVGKHAIDPGRFRP